MRVRVRVHVHVTACACVREVHMKHQLISHVCVVCLSAQPELTRSVFPI